MRKKPLFIIVIALIFITLISGIVFASISIDSDISTFGPNDEASDGTSVTPDEAVSGQTGDSDYTYIPPTLADITAAPEDEEDPAVTEAPFIPATDIDLELGSITIFVNKEYALPKTYRPDDLVQVNVYFNMEKYDERTLMRKEAARALEKLFAAAREDGYILSGVSGFRSYERQKKIFTNNIAVKGKEYTLRYSAVPGTSEHQTGLAIDVSSERSRYKLTTSFGTTPEGIWLAKNAHRYGYIIRYPKDKYEVTGYAYEPWHIRYVGKPLATYLYENNLTLDEYYNYTPSPGFDFEALYSDLINYVPKVTVAPIDGDGVVIGENGEIIDVDDSAETPDSELPEDDQETTPKPTKPPKDEKPSKDEKPTKPPKEDTSDDPDSEEPDDEEDIDTPEDDIDDASDEDGGVVSPGMTPVPTLPLTPTPTPSMGPSPSLQPTPTPTVEDEDIAIPQE